VALSSYGSITPGTTQINLQNVGDLCFANGGSPCDSGSPQSSPANAILAGFSATSGSTTFISSTQPGFNTVSSSDWTGDFANDFIVTTSATGFFTIPVGAQYIVFVLRDAFYADNLDKDNNFGVLVDIQNPAPAVPEPATYTMMLGGLGILAAVKRYRRA
jgi:hypothetical protein